MLELYNEFVKKLEQLFGKFDAEAKRFVLANNAKIARELGYSDSQFSRLINETATEGEYQRALKSVDRILAIEKLEKQLAKSKPGKPKGVKQNWIYLAILIASVVSTIIISKLISSKSEYSTEQSIPRDHTIRWTFESSFINPYVKLDDLPQDCNYPCYKYQGKWQLDKSYKLPFFRERNGYHYLATEVDMYARCMVEKSEKGDLIEGYEYQKHEIWFDKREWPMDSFLTKDLITNSYYQNLDFKTNKDFVKIADIHTFFRSEFQLADTLIKRTGKVIGRDLEMVDSEELSTFFKDEKKVEEVEQEVDKIIRNRLKDFSVPITCEDAKAIAKNISDIKDNDLMSFNCELTTSRMGIEYTKTYRLVDQYIKSDCINN